jgi:hypothetical protein
MTNHIFCEPRKGFVAHTRTSRLLAEDAKMSAWVGLFSEDLWLPIAHTVQALEKWPGSGEPTEAGACLALNTTDPFFKIMARDPARMRRFGTAMAAHASGEGFEVDRIVDDYDWGQLGEATVIDVQFYPSLPLSNQPSVRLFSSTNKPRWAAPKATPPSPSPPHSPSSNSSYKNSPPW